jgi:hypothetical protein
MNKPLHRISAPEADMVEVFRARCEAAAQAYAIGKIALLDAVDQLQDFAFTRELVELVGQDQIQAIMAEAFGPVRGDL